MHLTGVDHTAVQPHNLKRSQTRCHMCMDVKGKCGERSVYLLRMPHTWQVGKKCMLSKGHARMAAKHHKTIFQKRSSNHKAGHSQLISFGISIWVATIQRCCEVRQPLPCNPTVQRHSNRWVLCDQLSKRRAARSDVAVRLSYALLNDAVAAPQLLQLLWSAVLCCGSCAVLCCAVLCTIR